MNAVWESNDGKGDGGEDGCKGDGDIDGGAIYFATHNVGFVCILLTRPIDGKIEMEAHRHQRTQFPEDLFSMEDGKYMNYSNYNTCSAAHNQPEESSYTRNT
ncbi:hypothetical protein PS1_007224 [Malus domestica]